MLLKRAMSKYGRENFKKEILEFCSDNVQLASREIFWINEKNTLTPIGYNITPGGMGGDTTTHNPNKEKIITERAELLRKTVYKTKEFSDAIKNGKTGEYTISEKCHQSKGEQHKASLSLASSLYWEKHREKMLDAVRRGGITKRKPPVLTEKNCPVCNMIFSSKKSKNQTYCSKSCVSKRKRKQS